MLFNRISASILPDLKSMTLQGAQNHDRMDWIDRIELVVTLMVFIYYNLIPFQTSIFSRYCEYARNATFETICIRDDEERHLLTNMDLYGDGTKALERLNDLVAESQGDQEEAPKLEIDFDINIEPPSRPG